MNTVIAAVLVKPKSSQMLNTYLDGYAGKLKVKNWATFASIGSIQESV